MIFFNGKKADEKYLSFWMFLIWAIIGIGIFIGISIFYSASGDARQLEAQALANKLSSCLTRDFSYAELSLADFDIYSKCRLNKAAFETSNFYYFRLNIFELGSENLIKTITGGNNWKTECDLQFTKADDEKEKKFPQCAQQAVFVSDAETNKKYTISITAASNQR